ncbi:IAA-amino acid hydrolase ILR1-like protein 5 [Tanacetum coccineum]
MRSCTKSSNEMIPCTMKVGRSGTLIGQGSTVIVSCGRGPPSADVAWTAKGLSHPSYFFRAAPARDWALFGPVVLCDCLVGLGPMFGLLSLTSVKQEEEEAEFRKKLAKVKEPTVKKTKKERDPGKLKRPPTAFFLFMVSSAKKTTTLLLCMMMGIGLDATKGYVSNPYLDSGCQVLSVTCVTGGGAQNVIPPYVKQGGTLRSLTTEDMPSSSKTERGTGTSPSDPPATEQKDHSLSNDHKKQRKKRENRQAAGK